LESDLWPTNSVNDIDTVTSVSDYNGYAQINLPITYETYTVGTYVKVNAGIYVGVYRILAVPLFNQVVIDLAFTATATGTLQLYPYGYYIEVAVYAGIDLSHPLGTGYVNIGNFQALPDSNNIAKVDIREYIQKELSNTYTQTSGNDINLWVDFYIDYREVQIINGAQSFGSWDTDIADYCHAANNVLQVGNPYRGNLYTYLCDVGKVAGKWLTNFERLLWKDLRYFETSILIGADTWTLELIEYDSEGNALATQLIPFTEGYGVYRINFSELFISIGTAYFTLQAVTTYSDISEVLPVDYDVECLELVPPNAVVLTGEAGLGENVLNWTDTNNGEAEYQVWGYQGTDAPTLLDTVDGVTYTHVTTGTWNYFIVAIRNGNRSALSNVLSLTVIPFLFILDPSNN
jgi:hypothetical protein